MEFDVCYHGTHASASDIADELRSKIPPSARIREQYKERPSWFIVDADDERELKNALEPSLMWWVWPRQYLVAE